MVSKKSLLVFGVCFALFVVSFVIAEHVVLLLDGTTTKTINEDSSYVLNISVNNTNSGQNANVTMINITLPNSVGINFSMASTNGSSLGTGAAFVNTSTVASWRNTTWYVVNGTSLSYFWINISASAPGTYVINISVQNATGAFLSTINLSVLDVTNPGVGILNPTNGRNVSSTDFMFNLSVSDNVNVSACYVQVDIGSTLAMSLNGTLTGASYSMPSIAEGYHTATFYCVDNSALQTVNRTNFTIDSSAPSLSYGVGMDENASTVTRNWIYVNVSAIDGGTGVRNINFTLWNSSGIANSSRIGGLIRSINWTGLNNSLVYYYNATACDYVGNCQSLGARTITLARILVDLNSPADAVYTNVNSTNFVCSSNSSSQYLLTNTTFYLWNASSSLNYTVVRNNLNGTTNITAFNYNFTLDGVYRWNCAGLANQTVLASTSSNRTITFDTISPVVTYISTTTTASSAVFSYNVTDTNPVTCTFYVNDVSKGSDSSASYAGESNTLTASSLSAGTSYSGFVNCSDGAGNVASSSTVSFTTADAATTSSGSGSSSVALNLGSDFQAGVNKVMLKGWSLNFKTANAQDHNVKIDSVANGKVGITVSSTPQSASLAVGEEKKFELTGDNIYDLSVKLNSIAGTAANLYFRQINEAMPAQQGGTGTDVNNVGTGTDTNGGIDQIAGASSSGLWWTIGVIVLIVIAIVIVLIITLSKRKGAKYPKKFY